MVTVTIDGVEIQVTEGTNLVEAASKAGVEIPTFCYHPGLQVVGQCRICFVEVEGLPRLVTACSTMVQEGMVVLTASERVREAREAVMEFLLANHPLDCPVCDQAGECMLQDHSVDHGAASTHMVDERRTNPGRERRQLGPHIVQNQNRCIHCTRCVRFTHEVAETGELTMKSRGNHAYIDTFDGTPFDNEWSGCAADICPVGALTVKEFRFRARVWALEETSSICPGCSIGCGITIDHHRSIVHRFKPRENRQVNGWWMCDHGRMLADSLNQREISDPLQRDGDGQAPVSWTEALSQIKEWIGDQPTTRVVASANLSNEGLYLVKKILASHAGLEVVVPVVEGDQRRVKNGRGEWVTSKDAHPNATGARLMGLRTVDQSELEDFLMTSSGPLVILDNRSHPWLESEEAAQAVAKQKVILTGRTHTPLSRKADLVLPAASWVSMEGSYTSSTGRVQLTNRGIYPAGQIKPVWEILFLIGIRLGVEKEGPIVPRAIFEELVTEVRAYAGMTYRRLASESGIPVDEEVANVG
jgi:NADH-quinone oxidoreductase subunit G